VTRAFEKTAGHERMRFYGHVGLGVEVSREDLLARYHAVIYAIGTATDRRMGVPGEELAGSHAATEFVSWYNGHPDFSDLEFDLLRAKR
jgi:ferredoxin--NADP+ reductase